MHPILLLRVLWLREVLRRRDRWTRAQLETHQSQELRSLREFAYAHSPFYKRFHKNLTDAPLDRLPVLTKSEMMAHFDEVVTDRAVRLTEVETFLKGPHNLERFLGRFWVSATSGSTGQRGIFVSNLAEWTSILASYARTYEWAGVHAGLTHRTTMAIVSSRTPWHQSARVGASVSSPFTPTLRLDATDSLEKNVGLLNTFAPEVLVLYASMGRELANEQIAGRLQISPRAVFTASEVLTDETRQRIVQAWGSQPFNVYAATETAGIASECTQHAGMHLYEDLVITEVVDDHNRPVPPGEYGEKVLVTVLFSRTQPLIRYEMSDSIRLATHECPSNKPFKLIDGVQGRHEEVLYLPALAGGSLGVHPNVFHQVMERIEVGAWQIVQEAQGLNVLITNPSVDFNEGSLVAALRNALEAQGIAAPQLNVQRVSSIAKTSMGKAPLIKSNLIAKGTR